MSDRSHPASPRRLALARAAGWVAHSPSLTTAAAWIGALVALASTAPAQLAAWRALWQQSAAELATTEPAAGALALRAAATATSALPVVAVAAVTAFAAHLLQVRAFFVLRRRVPGAPQPPRTARHRVGAAAWALARAAALTAVGLAATWAGLDELAAGWRGQSPANAVAAGSRVALALVATWVALGAVELLASALLRQLALRMTASEQRQEVREQAGAGAFWRRWPSRAASAVGATRHQLDDATVLVLGDAVAAAVRWQPAKRPEPEVILVRRGAAVSYAVALARRSGVPVVRSPTLAAQLAAATARPEGDLADVPAPARAALAELVVAVRRAVAPR